jgi:Outer membrane protein beta-barrel domain
MLNRVVFTIALVCFAAVPATVSAQERVPHEASTAVGIDVGAFLPSDDVFDNSPIVSVLYEYYVTPRVSLRTGFGWTDPGFDRTAQSLRQLPLRVDVNYNWERGRWHPFVGTGIGAYFLQFKNNGESFGESETKVGLNAGGGIEYFLHRAVSFKGEARYHAVANVRGRDPSGVSLTGGLKTYF